jgi:putative ABC transport system ATP-binding protein
VADRPAIELRDVTVRFGEDVVLRDLSLQCAVGERLLVRGASGSGKSTVLRCVLGFVTPDEGLVLIEGQELSADSVWQLRHRLAYVAQEPDLGDGTTETLLRRPFEFKANEHLKDNLERVDELFDLLLLPRKILESDIDTLSGGEKQRVSLVQALLLDRPILLLDEASSALDERSAKAVVDLLAKRDDLTILAISHDVSWSDLAHRTIDLPGGAVEGALP